MRFASKNIAMVLFLLFIVGCNEEDDKIVNIETAYPKVIIVVLDGIRNSEVQIDSTSLMPYLRDSILPHGVNYTHFYNMGTTLTVPGHTAITTGVYQTIDNTGAQIPDSVSFMQKWTKKYLKSSLASWIITSKSKLAVLGNTVDSTWTDQFLPSLNCGYNGLYTSNRSDNRTVNKVIEIMNSIGPDIIIINLRETDIYAHNRNWDSYLNSIIKADSLTFNLWSAYRKNPTYKNKTYFFITNDHGRHLDSISNGFAGHGDDCKGCRHILFFAAGPTIKKGVNIDSVRSQIDIPVTISKILNFDFDHTNGDVMTEMFSDN